MLQITRLSYISYDSRVYINDYYCRVFNVLGFGPTIFNEQQNQKSHRLKFYLTIITIEIVIFINQLVDEQN